MTTAAAPAPEPVVKPPAVSVPHFEVARTPLLGALARVSVVTPRKTQLPALIHVLITARDGSLELTATDLDTTVRTSVPAKVSTEGTVLLPCKQFVDVVRAIAAPSITVRPSWKKGERQAEITGGRAVFRFPTLEAAEFPDTGAPTFGESLRIRGDALAGLLAQTVFCASREESRPILNGVLWEVRPSGLTVVATNGHRLAKAVISLPSEVGARDLIVPALALNVFRRVFPDLESELEIAPEGDRLAVRSGGTTLVTRLIEGPYPNYNQVIPKESPITVAVDRGAFLAAVKRVAVVASEQTRRLRLEWGTGRVRLTADTLDLGSGADEVALESYEGAELTIGFNADYLREIADALTTEQVRIRMSAPDSAVVIEPVGEMGVPVFYLLMPLQLVD